jgi:hypothetical protein
MNYSTLRKSIFVLVLFVSFSDHTYLTKEISNITKEIKTELKIEKQDIGSSIDLDCNQ